MKAELSLISAALLLGICATAAHASFQSCVNGPSDPGADYNISNKVSTATACTILLPLNDNDNDNPMPGFVNSKGFFGITDWLFDGKWDDLTASGGTDTSQLFVFSGGNQTGSFTYNASHGLGSIANIMMVFKDGQDTNLVGYMVSAANGSYSSPFTEPPFDFNQASTVKNISHISVYYQSSSTSSGGSTSTSSGGGQVPEPGVLGLLGLGLLGLAFARRQS